MFDARKLKPGLMVLSNAGRPYESVWRIAHEPMGDFVYGDLWCDECRDWHRQQRLWVELIAREANELDLRVHRVPVAFAGSMVS